MRHVVRTCGVKFFEVFANRLNENRLSTYSAADCKTLRIKNRLEIENLNGYFSCKAIQTFACGRITGVYRLEDNYSVDFISGKDF